MPDSGSVYFYSNHSMKSELEHISDLILEGIIHFLFHASISFSYIVYEYTVHTAECTIIRTVQGCYRLFSFIKKNIVCYTLQVDVIYKYNFYDDDNFRVFNEQHGDLLFEGHF